MNAIVTPSVMTILCEVFCSICIKAAVQLGLLSQYGTRVDCVWKTLPESFFAKVIGTPDQSASFKVATLALLRRCQVGHAGKRVWMIGFQHSFPYLHHLHL